MDKRSPENKARKVIEECADCDVCRFLMDSDQLINDCLRCRLQFNQLLPYKVQHPVELIKEAYSRNAPSGAADP